MKLAQSGPSNGRQATVHSIGSAQTNVTLAYIARQAEHHQKRYFQAEFLAILKKHRIHDDPRYVWG